MEDLRLYGIKQTDFRLEKDIQVYGCCFRSTLRIIEQKTLELLTWQQINEIYTKGLEKMVLGKNCSVLSYRGLLQAAQEVTKLKVRGFDIGTYDAKRKSYNYYEWVKKANFIKDENYPFQYRLREVTTQLGNRHWVLTDKNGELLFDPYPTPTEKDHLKDVLIRIAE